VIPEGAGAADGAYLRFPLDDLLRLVRIESRRHRAIVLGEDLGTLPDGFRERLQECGLSGMRVLWFERDQAGRFLPPHGWSPEAAAMTSTHDLPTVAGWWRERDIDWRAQLGQMADEAGARAERARDRAALWAAFRESGATDREMPDAQDGAAATDAAIAHVGGAGCGLALLPTEDLLALEEQPNLPGTTDEHPNWRRRLPADAATLLRQPAVAARIDALSRARRA
jgi:4-alpha-glucanotransferase